MKNVHGNCSVPFCGHINSIQCLTNKRDMVSFFKENITFHPSGVLWGDLELKAGETAIYPGEDILNKLEYLICPFEWALEQNGLSLKREGVHREYLRIIMELIK